MILLGINFLSAVTITTLYLDFLQVVLRSFSKRGENRLRRRKRRRISGNDGVSTHIETVTVGVIQRQSASQFVSTCSRTPVYIVWLVSVWCMPLMEMSLSFSPLSSPSLLSSHTHTFFLHLPRLLCPVRNAERTFVSVILFVFPFQPLSPLLASDGREDMSHPGRGIERIRELNIAPSSCAILPSPWISLFLFLSRFPVSSVTPRFSSALARY